MADSQDHSIGLGQIHQKGLIILDFGIALYRYPNGFGSLAGVEVENTAGGFVVFVAGGSGAIGSSETYTDAAASG